MINIESIKGKIRSLGEEKSKVKRSPANTFFRKIFRKDI